MKKIYKQNLRQYAYYIMHEIEGKIAVYSDEYQTYMSYSVITGALYYEEFISFAKLTNHYNYNQKRKKL